MQKSTAEITVTYAISEVAEFLGISVPTIRLYEREGLIISLRNESGHRVFTADDIERIRCLRSAITEKKISIQGIRHLLSLLPCWRLKNCPPEARDACPAYLEHDAPCWTLADRSWECQSAECRVCEVYAKHADCRSVKQVVAQFTLLEPVRPVS
jgi:MerR family transcriptional regulator, heat shock protein HspR